MLKHKNEKGALEDYIWHWFILAGYEITEDDLLVKAVSYGEYKWFSLSEMWDTGYDKKGGMILYHIQNSREDVCSMLPCFQEVQSWKPEKY